MGAFILNSLPTV